MAYIKNIAPTRNGFDELWDSLKRPTINKLIAGIQCKKTTKEDILKLTKEMRESHSLLDAELYRLSNFANDYNSKWATKNSYQFGTTEQLQNKIRSQVKRWLKLLNFTSPRCKPSLNGRKEQESYFYGSYLTYRPYELDIWGPASYGTLIYDLYHELEILVKHLEEGEQLCKDILKQEREINADPNWKAQLYDEQYQAVEDRSRDQIEHRYKQRDINTTNSMFEQMKSYPSEYDYKVDNFHKPNETAFNSYVIDLATLRLLDNDMSPKEYELLGDDHEKIKDFRFAMAHLDVLLDTKTNGKFKTDSILWFIKWCNVKPSTLKHKDNERVLFNYIKQQYHGKHTWPSWTTVFELNKIAKEEQLACMNHADTFERKLKRLQISMKHDEQNASRLNG